MNDDGTETGNKFEVVDFTPLNAELEFELLYLSQWKEHNVNILYSDIIKDLNDE